MRGNLKVKALLLAILFLLTTTSIIGITLYAGHYQAPETEMSPDLGVEVTLLSLRVDESLSSQPIYIEAYWDETNSLNLESSKIGWICETEVRNNLGGPELYELEAQTCAFDTPDEPHNVSITYCVYHRVPEGKIYFDIYPNDLNKAGCVTYYDFWIFTPHEYIHSSDGITDSDLIMPNANITVSWKIISRQ